MEVALQKRHQMLVFMASMSKLAVMPTKGMQSGVEHDEVEDTKGAKCTQHQLAAIMGFSGVTDPNDIPVVWKMFEENKMVDDCQANIWNETETMADSQQCKSCIYAGTNN